MRRPTALALALVPALAAVAACAPDRQPPDNPPPEIEPLDFHCGAPAARDVDYRLQVRNLRPREAQKGFLLLHVGAV